MLQQGWSTLTSTLLLQCGSISPAPTVFKTNKSKGLYIATKHNTSTLRCYRTIYKQYRQVTTSYL